LAKINHRSKGEAKMPISEEHSGVSRRRLLATAGAGVIAAAGVVFLPPPARATVETATSFLATKIGNRVPQPGRIKLTMPEIAENGNTVPVAVTVDSPMTEADHVKAIHIMADGNPSPEVASFHLSPVNGRAEITTRMRMSTTQNVWAVAEMSDGSVFIDKTEVKVTIGGCGG
jgi:sulfur-oxidizing protein SoxY